MKPILFLILLTGRCFFVSAQYDSAARYRMSSPTYYVAMDTLIERAVAVPSDTTEGGMANRLIREKFFFGSRVCNDVSLGTDMYEPLGLALSGYFAHFSDYCPGTGGGSWRCLGPFNNDYGAYLESQGRIDAIWVSPTDSSVILAGADEGGLWRTARAQGFFNCAQEELLSG